jgi:hypothetical protein
MPDVGVLSWNLPGQKVFETGIDRGVLYLRSGEVVPWNGLTSVNENFGQSSGATFYDGVKLAQTQTSSGFSATVSAITYPDELDEICSGESIRNGIHLGDQSPSSFGFSYRTMVGNDLAGTDAGYKLHLVYNVSATVSDRSYQTVSDDLDLLEFEWEFVAVPEQLEMYRPSTHLVIDTSKTSPGLVQIIEDYIYGTTLTAPVLPPMSTLLAIITAYDNFIDVTDNGDGTCTVSTDTPGIINDLGAGVYEIREATIAYVNSTKYLLSPTPDAPD